MITKKFIIFLFIFAYCSQFAQNICIEYNVYSNDKIILREKYISDTAIIDVYLHHDGENYSFEKIIPQKKIQETTTKQGKFITKYTKTFKELKKHQNEYYKGTYIIYNLQDCKKDSIGKAKTKTIFTKAEKEINGYLCNNAKISWEGKEKYEFDVWYYKYPYLDCKYINKFSIFDSIEGIVMEVYMNGKKYQEVSEIIPNAWFNP
jgi:hypothetical protein